MSDDFVTVRATALELSSAYQGAVALTCLKGVPFRLRYRLALLAQQLQPAHEEVLRSERALVDAYAMRGEDGAVQPVYRPGPDGQPVPMPGSYAVAPERLAAYRGAVEKMNQELSAPDDVQVRPLGLDELLADAPIEDEVALGEALLRLGPFLDV